MPEDNYVLIVEDDDDARLLFKTILTRNHYSVLVAETAEKARKVLEHVKRVNAILLDLTLPGGEDGLSFARYLRQQEAWKHVPIIAITARLFDHDRGNVFAAGCNAHLAKPVVARDLLDVLSLYLGGAAQA